MAWDTTVNFGMGKPKGNSLSGFHKVGNQGVFSGMVYRGDSRPPTVTGFGTGLFKKGFELQRAGVTVSGRTTSSTAQVDPQSGRTRGVVSASTDIKSAAYWAVDNTQREGWLYAMYIENEPWAAEATQNLMGTVGRDAAVTQKEIMFLGLPGHLIYVARKVKKVGTPGSQKTCLVGNTILNPGYSGNNPYGVAFKDPHFKILVDADPQVECE